MKTNELISALKEQEDSLKNFLGCCVNKQKAIVHNDINSLHDSLVYEEKLLSRIELNGKKISSAIENLAREFGLNLKAVSLSEFLNAVNNKTEINVKVINLLRNSIKDLVGKSSKINEQNKILIEHSRSFLRETIAMLIGLNKHPLLDRKV
jgi:hypothetical protein